MLKTFTDNFEDTSSEFTEEHFYTLDTIGLYHYQSFLSSHEVQYINQILDKWIAQSPVPPSKFSFFEQDKIFCNIMTKKWILSACERMIGKWFRLDHCVGIQQPGKIKSSRTGNWVDQGYESGNIHGGQYASQGSVYYNSNQERAFSGHMTLGISLIGQQSEDGGFCFIPGSHKQTNFGNGSTIFKETLKQDYTHQSIHVPKLQAGDAVFFPENLMHGMKPMRPGTRRRAIYFKFVPSFACWRPYHKISHYKNMATNDVQLRILSEPYVADFPEEGPLMGDNIYREPTQ